MVATSARLRGLLGARLLASPWLRRLGRISFLGTLDRHPQSARAPDRLQHSLGVAALGLDLAESIELSGEAKRVFVAACLLHDIGHYPLSHAAEPGFKRALGVDHHVISRWLILGDGPIPAARSLRPDLLAAGVDPERTWSIVQGEQQDPELAPLAALLRAPINLDTLDGITRAARAFRIPGLRLPSAPFLLRRGRLWIAAEALPHLDRFWALKDRVYGDIINLPSNILCEAGLSAAVEGRFDRSVFEQLEAFDDRALAHLVDEQAHASGLSSGGDSRYRLIQQGLGPFLLRRARKRYFLDRSVIPGADGLPIEAWPQRYRHERQVLVLVPRHSHSQLVLPGFSDGLSGDDAPPLEAPDL
ncbi:MAG: HD domain-containing protein [Nannocystis sp.]|nr:HD domain-containing protein [Nannocystis sp.]